MTITTGLVETCFAHRAFVALGDAVIAVLVLPSSASLSIPVRGRITGRGRMLKLV